MSTQQEAWRSYRTLQERQAWFNLLILQGYNQLQTGNMLASIQAYEKAMEFYDAYPIADTDEYVEYVLKPLGNNYTRLADYDAALYIHRKTLQLLQGSRDTAEIAGVYANLSTCARWKNELSNAAAWCRMGMANANEQTALYGLLLNTYADILLQENKTDSALHFSTKALQQLKNGIRSTSMIHRLPAGMLLRCNSMHDCFWPGKNLLKQCNAARKQWHCSSDIILKPNKGKKRNLPCSQAIYCCRTNRRRRH